jgi:hypothetical protein
LVQAGRKSALHQFEMVLHQFEMVLHQFEIWMNNAEGVR